MASTARKHIEARSAYNAVFFRSDRPWAAISISSCSEFPDLSEENRVGLLRLSFEDTTDPGKPESFNESLAIQVLDFVQQVWDSVDVILIHCEIGLSRSPAVASALSQIYYDDAGHWFDFDFPNRLVYDLLVEAHARRVASS
jgi:predicted protein tyrosine phosphatase